MLCKLGLSHHAVSVRLSVCLSRSHILSKRINIIQKNLPSGSGIHTILVFLGTKCYDNTLTETPKGVECRWGRQKLRFWAIYLASLRAVNATGRSHKLWHLSLVVRAAELVDGGRRRRNVYDKKSQRYGDDNRTAHLTARSDKSVAYVTNSKRLLDVLYYWS